MAPDSVAESGLYGYPLALGCGPVQTCASTRAEKTRTSAFEGQTLANAQAGLAGPQDRVDSSHGSGLVRTGTKQELTSKGEVIEFIVEGISDALITEIQEVATQLKVEGNCITITPKDINTISAIPQIIINQGGKLLSLNSHMESLEDIFLRLIKGEENSDE